MYVMYVGAQRTTYKGRAQQKRGAGVIVTVRLSVKPHCGFSASVPRAVADCTGACEGSKWSLQAQPATCSEACCQQADSWSPAFTQAQRGAAGAQCKPHYK